MTNKEALAQLVAAAQVLGAGYVRFDVSDQVADRLVELGGRTESTVYRDPGEDDFVIEEVTVIEPGVRVSVLRPRRPATDEERANLDRDLQAGTAHDHAKETFHSTTIPARASDGDTHGS